MVHQEQLHVQTRGHRHMIDLTAQVAEMVPIAQGQMVLGTWQQIFHLECDVRARQRTLVVTVTGE